MRRSPLHASLKTPVTQQAQKVDTILARVEARRAQLLARFAQMAQAGGWKVARAETPRQAVEYILSIVREQGAASVVRSDEPVFRHVGMDAALRRAGVAASVASRARGTSPEELRRVLAEAPVGLTGVDFAIAETGTCVLLPRRGVSRLVSLLPAVHIAIVEAARVVETIDDVLALQRLAYQRGRGRSGSAMQFITGPSRSGDIEQTITIGVHGPKEAHCVLLG